MRDRFGLSGKARLIVRAACRHQRLLASAIVLAAILAQASLAAERGGATPAGQLAQAAGSLKQNYDAAAGLAQLPGTTPEEKYVATGASYKLGKASCPAVSLSVTPSGNQLVGELVLRHKPPIHGEAKGSVSASHRVSLDFNGELSNLHAEGTLASDVLKVRLQGNIPGLSRVKFGGNQTACHWDLSAKKGDQPDDAR